MRRRPWYYPQKGKISGVYAAFHATDPKKVYIGQALNCADRNAERDLMGVRWQVVRRMPGATRRDRLRAEREVADSFAARGFSVLSRNTTEASRAQYLKTGKALRGKKHSPESIAKVAAANRGKKRSPEFRAKCRAAQLGRKKGLRTRMKHSRNIKARWQDPEYRSRMCAERKRRWANPAYKEKMRAIHRQRQLV